MLKSYVSVLPYGNDIVSSPLALTAMFPYTNAEPSQ